jgi:spore maturation protein CgeB
MKVLLFWTFYDRYLKSIYEHTHLADKPYAEQKNLILGDHFGWVPDVVSAMGELGCEVEILIVNAEPLQQSWAQENGFRFDRKSWRHSIAIEQVSRFEPDVTLTGITLDYYGAQILEIKKRSKKVFSWISAQTPARLDLSGIDCVLTSHSNFRADYRAKGIGSETLLPAFNKKVWDQVSGCARDIECSFIGSISHAHLNRIDTLSEVADQTPIQIWGDLPKIISRGLSDPAYLASFLKLRKLKQRTNSGVWGRAMYQTLARSQITVNVHVDAASGLAGNMRMFEATGTGALLITEDAPNIGDIFEPGRELVTYRSNSELTDLIRHFLAYPDEAQTIAKAGQNKTFAVHNTHRRSMELKALFEGYL